MSEKNHKLGIEIPKKYTGYCQAIQFYIDKERVNSALGLYPLNKEGNRVESFEEMDFAFDALELEVRDIGEIAYWMNKETFEKFCNLWREYHGQQ